MDSKSVSGDPKNTTEHAASSSRGISRRSVVKAGAAAAWTVPLVQVVAAAPAIAASGPAKLQFSQASAEVLTDANKSVRLTLKVKNNGGQSTVALQVTLTVNGPTGNIGATVPSGSGWTLQATGKTFVFTASSQVAGGQESPSLVPTFTFNKAGNFVADASATASGATGISTTFNVARP